MKGIIKHIIQLKEAVKAGISFLYPETSRTTMILIPVRRHERRRP